LMVLLDYDGTLVEFSASPMAATPDLALLALLRQLAHRRGTSVDIISGRSRESLEDFLGDLEIGLHAEHGLWSRPRASQDWRARTTLPPPWLNDVRLVFERVVRRTDGALLEVKSGALAFHYRATEPQLAHRRIQELRALLRSHPMADAFELLDGNQVLEVRPRGIGKGDVATALLAENPHAAILALGDDRTDEALFAALPPTAVTIHVGTGQSVARYRLAGVGEARALLRRLLEAPHG
jgi:trehalose 6-phosphate synthase/phosphatase